MHTYITRKCYTNNTHIHTYINTHIHIHTHTELPDCVQTVSVKAHIHVYLSLCPLTLPTPPSYLPSAHCPSARPPSSPLSPCLWSCCSWERQRESRGTWGLPRALQASGPECTSHPLAPLLPLCPDSYHHRSHLPACPQLAREGRAPALTQRRPARGAGALRQARPVYDWGTHG